MPECCPRCGYNEIKCSRCGRDIGSSWEGGPEFNSGDIRLTIAGSGQTLFQKKDTHAAVVKDPPQYAQGIWLQWGAGSPKFEVRDRKDATKRGKKHKATGYIMCQSCQAELWRTLDKFFNPSDQP